MTDPNRLTDRIARMAAGKLDDYVIQKRLAPALFGDVLLCAHKPSGGRAMAVKRVQLAAAAAQVTLASHKKVREDVALERALGRRFRESGGHANVLPLQDDIEFDGYLYLVTPYCERGELYEIVSAAPEGKLDVAVTREYLGQIARGVRFVHAQGFAHRDLSLENVLVTSDNVCQVCDFGLAASTAQLSTETVGKMFYMAPEVLAGRAPYDAKKADVWSLGVMLFIMLVGAPPVERAASTDARFRMIASQGIRQLIDRWELTDELPAAAIALLAEMLEADPARRATMDRVIAHPFLSPRAVLKEAVPPVIDIVAEKSLAQQLLHRRMSARLLVVRPDEAASKGRTRLFFAKIGRLVAAALSGGRERRHQQQLQQQRAVVDTRNQRVPLSKLAALA